MSFFIKKVKLLTIINSICNKGYRISFRRNDIMSIIGRFKDIMSANINALLDKAENPEKMVDQYLRNMNKIGRAHV